MGVDINLVEITTTLLQKTLFRQHKAEELELVLFLVRVNSPILIGPGCCAARLSNYAKIKPRRFCFSPVSMAFEFDDPSSLRRLCFCRGMGTAIAMPAGDPGDQDALALR